MREMAEDDGGRHGQGVGEKVALITDDASGRNARFMHRHVGPRRRRRPARAVARWRQDPRSMRFAGTIRVALF